MSYFVNEHHKGLVLVRDDSLWSRDDLNDTCQELNLCPMPCVTVYQHEALALTPELTDTVYAVHLSKVSEYSYPKYKTTLTAVLLSCQYLLMIKILILTNKNLLTFGLKIWIMHRSWGRC